MGRPRKRSLTLRGHRTSVSLEDEFWEAFCQIAVAQSCSVNALAADIDANRVIDSGLAAALRLYVLRHYQRAAEAASTAATSPDTTSPVTKA
jgi:predicted DNA-binding ribbon-helix-helix protein